MKNIKLFFLIFVITVMILISTFSSLLYSDDGGGTYTEYRIFNGETCQPPQGDCLWPPIIVSPKNSQE